MINIVYLENGLTPQLRKEVAVETTSIKNVAPDWSIPYIAFLDGKAILRKDWDHVLEGDHILAFIEADAIPQGGGGGGTNPLRMVLMIAVMVYAPYLATEMLGIEGAAILGATGVQAVTAGIAMAGMALVDAIVPVKPLSTEQQQALAAPSPTYNTQAQGNSARINAAIPEHFGRLRCYPDFAAQPYAEYIDNEQYLYELLCVGRGEYNIETIKIEDTPIQNFNDVSTEIIPPYTVFDSFATKVSNSLEVSGQEVQSFSVMFTANGTTNIVVTLANHGFTLNSVIHVSIAGNLYKDSPIVSIGGVNPTTQTIDTFTVNIGNIYGTSTGDAIVIPVVGYFIANAEGTAINALSFDLVAPRGLYHANDSGGLEIVTVYPVIEIREVDNYGNFVAGSSWQSPSSNSLIDLGWGDWSKTSIDATYIAPPANTADTEYKVTCTFTATTIKQTSGPTIYSYGNNYSQVVTKTFDYTTDIDYTILPYGGSIENINITGYTTEVRNKRKVAATSKAAATTTPQRWTLKYSVPNGRYACRMYRTGTSAASTDTRTADSFIWAGLRGYYPESTAVTFSSVDSNSILINYTNHGYSLGDTVQIGFRQTILGGAGIDTVIAPYTITTRNSNNSFTIYAPSHAGYTTTTAYVYRDHGDVTLLAVKMRASNSLSLQASRKLNVIATRKLPTWSRNPTTQAISWGAKTATRSISDAIIYAAKQVGMSDAQIDYEGISNISNSRETLGEHFDGRFDNFVSFWEAITKMSAVIRAKPFLQAGILRIIRDSAVSIPTALFSQRNIVKNSLSINYLLPTEDSAKKVAVKYFDNVNWQPSTVNAYLGPTDPKSTPAVIDMFGITDRTHAYNEGLYHVATNLYRRKLIKFQTEMDGFIPTFGDLIVIQHDLPAWGQSGVVVGWDSATKTLTLSEAPEWFIGQTHYIALRSVTGSLQGDDAYIVTAHPTDPYKVIIGGSKSLGAAYSSTPYIGLDKEKTHYAFGPGEAWRQPAKVLTVRPQSFTIVEIECVAEDPAVHTVQALANPVPPTNYSNLNAILAASNVTTLYISRVISYPNRIMVSWNPAINAEYYIIEQQDTADNWVSVGQASSLNITIDLLVNSGKSIRVAAVTNIGQGIWCTELVPSPIAPANANDLILDLENTYITAIPAVTGIKPVDFKTYEYRLYKDTGTEDFWDLDPTTNNILVTQSIVDGRFNLLDVPIPRISETGITYRVACRILDTANNYSAISALGTIVVATIK